MAAEMEARRRPLAGPLLTPNLHVERRQGYLPADFVSLFYLTVTSVLVVVGHDRLPNWPVWLAVQLVLIVGVLALRFVPRQGLPVLQLIRETYALWLLPVAYRSIGVLNRILHIGYFDHRVREWDLALFGGHPHTYLAKLLPWPVLSEFLHFSYFFYLLLVPILGFTLFFQRRFEALRAFATTQALVMYSCYLIFIFFPVLGPWYTSARPEIDGPALFPRLVHAVLQDGGSRGAAFPSSHVAGAVAVAAMAIRFSRRLSYALGLLALGIAVGTVYGGFHYAIDAVCGLAFGLLVSLVGPRLHATILRRIRLAVVHLRFPYLRFRWRDGRIRGELVRPRGRSARAARMGQGSEDWRE